MVMGLVRAMIPVFARQRGEFQWTWAFTVVFRTMPSCLVGYHVETNVDVLDL